jgi:hypothetical protein
MPLPPAGAAEGEGLLICILDFSSYFLFSFFFLGGV